MKSKAHDNEESIFTLQKQPPEMIYAEKLFLKLFFCIIHRKTFLFESLFKKIAGVQGCSFIKVRHQHRCFAENIAKF